MFINFQVFYSIGKYKILSYTTGVGLEGVQAPFPRGDRERSDHQRGVSPYGQENSSLKLFRAEARNFLDCAPGRAHSLRGASPRQA